jgi:hypothetical protein
MRYALRLRRMNLCQLRNERDAVAAETQRLLTIDTLHDLAGCGCDCHLTRTIGTIETCKTCGTFASPTCLKPQPITHVYSLDRVVKTVAIDDEIRRQMRGFARLRHDEIDDLVEDLQLVEKWLADLDGAVSGAIPLDSLAKAVKYARQTRKRLLAANHHDTNDVLDLIERKRQRAEQADREAARTIRPGVAP